MENLNWKPSHLQHFHSSRIFTFECLLPTAAVSQSNLFLWWWDTNWTMEHSHHDIQNCSFTSSKCQCKQYFTICNIAIVYKHIPLICTIQNYCINTYLSLLLPLLFSNLFLWQPSFIFFPQNWLSLPCTLHFNFSTHLYVILPCLVSYSKVCWKTISPKLRSLLCTFSPILDGASTVK